MADRRASLDAAGQVESLAHDEGDGTYSVATAAHLRIWNGSSWARWDGTVSAAVSNFPATQAVSVAALPLPTGATTDATFTAAVGSAGVDAPAYGTVLDRLANIERAVCEQGEAITAALQDPPAQAPRQLTLLHRR